MQFGPTFHIMLVISLRLYNWLMAVSMYVHIIYEYMYRHIHFTDNSPFYVQ